jgi:DNA-binding transcriptional LysR family regulator
MHGFSWDDLAVALAVARAGRVADAARRLKVDPSTVSRRLAALEAALGAALFVRTPDGLIPTEAMAELLPAAERMEAAAADAARAVTATVRSGVDGVVRLAVAESFAAVVLPPHLPGLLQQHPALRLDLVVSSGLADLSRREADLAVRFVRPTRGDLVAKRLGATGYAVWTAPSYLRDRADLAWASLDWIGWDEPWDDLPEARWLRDVVGATPRLRATSAMAQIEAARAGAGALLLPRATAAFLPDLVQLPGPPVSLRGEAWLVGHAALRDVPRVDAVWRWLEGVAGSLVGEP